MKIKQIITHLLDTDTYKISMLQAFWHQYPTAVGYWEFKCRNEDVKLGFLAERIKKQLSMMNGLSITGAECTYLHSLGYMQEDFIDWLHKDFKLNSELVNVNNNGGILEISTRGKLIDINIWEVYILAIVNQLYFEDQMAHSVKGRGRRTAAFIRQGHDRNGMARLDEKIEMLKDYPNLVFAEFGTRRRFSKEWQDKVVETLVEQCPNIVGTSNIHLAMKHGLKPIGTVAHSFTMAHLGLVDRIDQAQSRALHVWQQEYGQDLGIALSDTFTTDAFLRDFNFSVARAYQGVRQDSGDAFEFGKKMIAHYESIGIDPRRKTIVFSDGLDIPKCISLWKAFSGLINISFGVGTNLTNDFGIKTLNIVMKLLECNGTPLVKLSDASGKEMGDPEMIRKVKEAYQVT